MKSNKTRFLFRSSCFFSFILLFSFNLYACDYELVIWDTYGDGWDGEVKIQKNCGSGWVNVTGWQSVAGSGPDVITFTVDDTDGCSYRLRYIDNAGLWSDEEFFEVYDAQGNLVLSGDGSGGSPQNIGFTPSCATPTCSDGIQNQGETGIDCGGPCTACAPSCTDGIQNQDETDIDCGGVCPDCPTCSDGIQNQGETGIDCGGPCSVCPVLCSDLGFENMASGADQILVDGWELMIGRNTVAGPYTVESIETHASGNCSANFTSHSPAAYCGTGGTGIKVYHNDYQHHDIKPSSTSGISDLIDVPTLPNFSGSNTRCIRLGGQQQAGQQASGMRTTFTINDPYLVYHYILRFEASSHTVDNRGFCTFTLKDNVNNVLPCGSFEVYENGPGETWAYDNSWDTWYMEDWKSIIIDVSDYIGQSITIEAWVADCQEGAHGGWGYFDFECLASGTPDCSARPLPIELKYFTAQCDDNQPLLSWTTSSETENDYFTIYHSSDGIHYNEMAIIDAVGNSNNETHYEYIPTDLNHKNNYFYLTQTDFNGAVERFNTISFEDCLDDKLGIYSDQQNNIHIIGAAQKEIRLYDATGKLIKQWIPNERHEIFNSSELSKGLYFVQLNNSLDGIHTQKILIK